MTPVLPNEPHELKLASICLLDDDKPDRILRSNEIDTKMNEPIIWFRVKRLLSMCGK